MQKIYHMIIQPRSDYEGKVRREYLSPHQGSAPEGWVCVGVCGYHEKPKEVQYPCRNCVYYAACGESMRTEPCKGRMTKREMQQGR